MDTKDAHSVTEFIVNTSYVLGIIKAIGALYEDYRETCELIESEIIDGNVEISKEVIESIMEIINNEAKPDTKVEVILFLIGGSSVLKNLK